ncbi:MAG: DNA polymerase III subunit delta [Phycisphaerae bacterium]
MAKQEKAIPIFVIAGQDIYLRTQALTQLRRQLLGEDQGLGEVRVEGKNAELAAVLDELRTLPFLAERRVVIIDDADKFISENRESLEDYLKTPSPDGVLILIADSWRKATRLDKQINQIGKIILVEPMKGQQLIRWLTAYAGQLDKTLTPACAEELLAIVGTETGRLANELEKLSIYVGQRKQITSADLQALSGQTAQENVFLITDLMAEGKTTQVLNVLNQILDMDRSAEFSMVGVLTFSLRRLLKAKSMLESGINQRDVLSACKMFYPAIAERFLAQVKRFTADRLKNLINQLTQIDYANKTGLGQARLNLEKFILCATTNK